jgi:hypothetical protein
MPGDWSKVDPGFLAREGAVYRGLEGTVLQCTIETNRPAGARWLAVVSGKRAVELDARELLSAVQQAVRSVEQIGEWELADVGWLVALRVQDAVGGELVWNEQAAGVALALPGGTKLDPMRVIAESAEGQTDLTEILQRNGSGQASAHDCTTVPTRDVLEQRSLLSGKRRR